MNKNLNQWLAYLEQGMQGGVIELGLARVKQVKQVMTLNPLCPVIIVGGTNGKGSVCAFLTEIYKQAGYKVGTLTSPHLLRYNERVRINGHPVADETIVYSFERIEEARGDTSLTYFEFNVLAAVDIFIQQQVEVMILEVGLGGRLDAANIFDADAAVVVNVDLDHQSYLGDTIEDIAYEKAGIFRAGKPAIIGQFPVPKTMESYVSEIGAKAYIMGQDFAYQKMEQQWSFRFQPVGQTTHSRHALPVPVLRGSYQIHNASCALAVIECLNQRLPIDIGAIKKGLLLTENIARFQVLPGRPLIVWDVAHNPHAARALKQNLVVLPYAKRRIAVFSMLKDKDIKEVVKILQESFDEWFIAPLNISRAMPVEEIQAILMAIGITNICCFSNIKIAYKTALSEVTESDRITVFGSFHTIAQVMAENN